MGSTAWWHHGQKGPLPWDSQGNSGAPFLAGTGTFLRKRTRGGGYKGVLQRRPFMRPRGM